ncbi:MAG: hypothetical protein RLZZ366_1599 [Pseudomonadota bacterium]|jgi:hypothetical protein
MSIILLALAAALDNPPPLAIADAQCAEAVFSKNEVKELDRSFRDGRPFKEDLQRDFDIVDDALDHCSGDAHWPHERRQDALWLVLAHVMIRSGREEAHRFSEPLRYGGYIQKVETWFDHQKIRFQQSFIAWDTPDMEVFRNVDLFASSVGEGADSSSSGFCFGSGVGLILRGKMMQKRIETGLHSDLSDSPAKAADELRRR